MHICYVSTLGDAHITTHLPFKQLPTNCTAEIKILLKYLPDLNRFFIQKHLSRWRPPAWPLFSDQRSHSGRIGLGTRRVINNPRQMQVFEYSWHHARRVWGGRRTWRLLRCRKEQEVIFHRIPSLSDPNVWGRGGCGDMGSVSSLRLSLLCVRADCFLWPWLVNICVWSSSMFSSSSSTLHLQWGSATFQPRHPPLTPTVFFSAGLSACCTRRKYICSLSSSRSDVDINTVYHPVSVSPYRRCNIWDIRCPDSSSWRWRGLTFHLRSNAFKSISKNILL